MPKILKTEPNLNITKGLMLPLLATMAFGGVEKGKRKEKPMQMVAISMIRLW